jgi:hypothetical protein
MTWHELAGYLSRPIIGDAKNAAGAWSPARYTDNVRRKSSLESIGALVVDVDENGDVDRLADLFDRYDAVVHETFSSTPDAPRCRVVLRLASAIDAPTYEKLHALARAHLAACGVTADDGAKDASRLSYAPVRRPGTGYRFRQINGGPLDALAVIAAQPLPTPKQKARPPSPTTRDAYARGALRRAAIAVSSATPGMRHLTLCREAYSLARLGLDEPVIEGALLHVFVGAAGEGRRREGTRTICDAVRARREVTS